MLYVRVATHHLRTRGALRACASAADRANYQQIVRFFALLWRKYVLNQPFKLMYRGQVYYSPEVS